MNLLTLTQKVDANDAILGFFVAWLERMARRVDRLDVIALQKGTYDLPDNVEVISLGKDQGAGTMSMLFAFQRALWRLCRRHKPDAILAHMVPNYVLYAMPMARLHNIPIDLWYTHKGVDRSLRRAHLFVRKVFTASEESFRLPSSKKIVTGHGIDTEQFKPDPDMTRHGILTVGRIAPSKDQEVLIRAVAILQERGHDASIETRILGEPLLAADRAYRAGLDSLVERHALKNQVQFIGTVPHSRLAGFYQEARILVNASHTGSVDKVVLEAMAAGALPLTCNESFVPLLGSLAEQLVFKKHDADDLAARIEAVLNLDEQAYEEISVRLRDLVVSGHNLDRLIDRLVAEMNRTH